MTSHRSFWIRMASDSLNKNLNTYFMRLSLEEAVTVLQFSRDFISPLALQCYLAALRLRIKALMNIVYLF